MVPTEDTPSLKVLKKLDWKPAWKLDWKMPFMSAFP